MPIPGLNPLEKAPPPNSNDTAASLGQVARLHQRITDLERRSSALETKTAGAAWVPLNPTYTSPWTAYDSGYAPCYMIYGEIVYLSGLLGANAGAGAATILTLPSFLAPEWPLAGSAGSRAQFFPVAGFNGSAAAIYSVYIYPRDSSVAPGRMSSAWAVPANGYISLSGIHYRKRVDQ